MHYQGITTILALALVSLIFSNCSAADVDIDTQLLKRQQQQPQQGPGSFPGNNGALPGVGQIQQPRPPQQFPSQQFPSQQFPGVQQQQFPRPQQLPPQNGNSRILINGQPTSTENNDNGESPAQTIPSTIFDDLPKFLGIDFSDLLPAQSAGFSTRLALSGQQPSPHPTNPSNDNSRDSNGKASTTATTHKRTSTSTTTTTASSSSSSSSSSHASDAFSVQSPAIAAIMAILAACFL